MSFQGENNEDLDCQVSPAQNALIFVGALIRGGKQHKLIYSELTSK